MIDRVALLRGINVGGHRVKMGKLRSIFEGMGFGDVATYIASGNVLFTSDETDDEADAARIETGLCDALGYAVPTFLRSYDAVRAVVDSVPDIDFDAATADERLTYVVFLKAEADPEIRARFASLESEYDRFTFHGREVYWSLAGKLSSSPLFGQGLERAVGEPLLTMRNTTTVTKLLAKLAARRG